MINPQWLKLPMSRTNFHGPKDVRAIEVLLYFTFLRGTGYTRIAFSQKCKTLCERYTKDPCSRQCSSLGTGIMLCGVVERPPVLHYSAVIFFYLGSLSPLSQQTHNVATTSRRCSDIVTTLLLLLRCVFAGLVSLKLKLFLCIG